MLTTFRIGKTYSTPRYELKFLMAAADAILKNASLFQYCILAREKALQKIREAEEAEEIALKNYEYLSNYTAESLEVFLKENEEWVSSAARA
jgi:hypothetical protein